MLHKKIYLLFLFFFVTMLPSDTFNHPSWGAAVSSEPPDITLNIKDEPLISVIEKISKATGYQIIINEKWSDFLVSASIKNVPLHDGLRGILSNLNHAIIVNDIEKKLSIIIYGSPVPAKKQKKVDSDVRQTVDFRDLEVIPPDKPGERGVTQRELDAILAREKQIDPLDVEVIPPMNPGEKGVTQRELNAMLARENKMDPLDVEVIPPRTPGERGVTQREINAHQNSEPMIDPQNLEVVPPGNPGERGVTQSELNAIKASENRVDPLDVEVIPPQHPGERGVTQRELIDEKSTKLPIIRAINTTFFDFIIVSSCC